MNLRTLDHYRRLPPTPTQLSDFLPWLDLVAPGVILHDDGSLQATIALLGPDLRQQPPPVQASAMLKINNALRQLDKGWLSHGHTLRFFLEPDTTPRQWSSDLARAIHEEHVALQAQEPLLESQHFVTLCYKPPSKTMQWLESFLWKPTPDAAASSAWWSYLEAFQTTVRHLQALLNGVMVSVTQLDDTQVYNFLYAILNQQWKTLRVPANAHYLARQLDDQDIEEWSPLKRGGQYLRTVTIADFPGASLAVILARLDDLHIPFVASQRWVPDDAYTTQKTLKKLQEVYAFHRKGQLRNMGDRIFGDSPGAEDPMKDYAVQEIKEARVTAGTEDSTYGHMTFSATVWDASWATSEAKIEAMRAAINSLGFVAKVEGVNSLGAYLGTMPGLKDPNPRKPKLKSMNVAHMMAVDGIYAGPKWNDEWQCAPFYVVRTSRSNPYRYQPFYEGVAHTFFSGPSTTGKTTWKDKLRVMVRQVPLVRDIGLDVKGDSRVTTYCLGGQYDDLGNGSVQVQPYREIHRPSEFDWAVEWTLRYLADRKIRLDARTMGMIKTTMARLSQVEPAARTITGWCTAFVTHDDHGITTSRAKLHQVDAGELRRLEHQRARIQDAMGQLRGGILDGSTSLQIHDVHTFELETLLKSPEKAKLVLRVVDHLIDEALDGRPTLLWYDEVQALLDDIGGRDLPESIATLNERIRRARSKNVMLLAGTQNVEDLLDHQLGPVFLNNCPNKIFFPNAEALTDQNVETYTKLGLPYRHIEALAAAQYRAEWLHKSPMGIRMVEDRLGPLALAVCGRSGKKWHAVVDEVLAQVGPEGFKNAWLTRMGVSYETHDRSDAVERVLATV